MMISLDQTFAALADPTRRAILGALAQGKGLSVGEIAQPFAMSLPAVSKHLDVLETAGLLTRNKTGRSVICRLEPTPMEAAMRWLSDYEKFWAARLDALTAFLEDGSWTPPSKISPSASSEPSKPRPSESSPPGPIRKR